MRGLSSLIAGVLVASLLVMPDEPARAQEAELIFFSTRIELDGGVSDRGRFAGNWVGDGRIGTDEDRFWWKTKGEMAGGTLESADLQLLYSRMVAPYWDLQAGYRHEFRPSRANYAVLALVGLAPYWVETDFELFFGGPGDVGGRLRLEHDLMWTQRLITRGELTLDWSAGNDRRHGQGAGLRRGEFELQTRYEISREVAPYVAVRYAREFGETARLTRKDGRDPQSFVFSLGLRLFF